MWFRIGLAISAIVASAACSDPAEQPGPGAAAQTPAASGSAHAVVVSKAPRGAVLVLEPTVSRPFPLPPGAAIMDQFGRAFIPNMLIVRAGQVVEFRNSEDVLHNVHVQKGPAVTEVFNVDRPPFDVYKHTFVEEGFYTVQCDMHIDMRAAIVVTSTPYAGVADERGSFMFPDVTPGSYKLRLYGEGQARDLSVEVSGPRTEVAAGAP